MICSSWCTISEVCGWNSFLVPNLRLAQWCKKKRENLLTYSFSFMHPPVLKMIHTILCIGIHKNEWITIFKAGMARISGEGLKITFWTWVYNLYCCSRFLVKNGFSIERIKWSCAVLVECTSQRYTLSPKTVKLSHSQSCNLFLGECIR